MIKAEGIGYAFGFVTIACLDLWQKLQPTEEEIVKRVNLLQSKGSLKICD